MAQFNYNRIWHAIEHQDKLPRKAKKHILGAKMSNNKLGRLLKSVKIIESVDGGQSEILPFEFCPKCGCTQTRLYYEENYSAQFCLRCNHKVSEYENSTFCHCLEYDDYTI